MDYFLTLTTETGWTISPRWLADNLPRRWVIETLRTFSDEENNHCLEFQVQMEHSTLTGALARSQKAVMFEGDLRDCARFALWLRSIPAPQELIFCDESCNIYFPLNPGMTEEEFLQACRTQ